MDILKSILTCFPSNMKSREPTQAKLTTVNRDPADEKTDLLAQDIVDTLLTSPNPTSQLHQQLFTTPHTTSWTANLAKRILHHLEAALKASKPMAGPMKRAYDRATKHAKDFVEKHPFYTAVIVTVVAIVILSWLLPWVVEALGFGELGPVAGSFAAWWQSCFPDVEAGSFFAFLQRMGMIRARL